MKNVNQNVKSHCCKAMTYTQDGVTKCLNCDTIQ